MTALLLVIRNAAGWTALVTAAVIGLVAVATAVDAGADASAWRRTPGVVVQLTPLIAALGAGLAAARMAARGERLALQAAGLAPARTGLATLAVGAALGLAGWMTHDHLAGEPSSRAWVWVDDALVRRPDGLVVRVDGERLVPLPDRATPAEMARAAQLLRPSAAAGEVLRSSTAQTAVAERRRRGLRAVACGGLAWLAWLPLAGTPGGQVAAALALGMGWQVAELGGGGAWPLGPALALTAIVLGLVAGLRASRASPAPVGPAEPAGPAGPAGPTGPRAGVPSTSGDLRAR